jgi:uncharacterized damage-inducible protein DinB
VSEIQKEMLGLADFAYQRLINRLDGLTDDEYLWEPSPDCWSIRPNGDGTFRGDWGLIFDATPPVTTLAWRLSHIVDCLTADRCATWLGLDPEPGSRPDRLPGTAGEARTDLERGYAAWRGYVAAADDEVLAEKSGPIAGEYADYTRASFVLHIIDELIHHAAEVALLRDLYRANRSYDTFVGACLRADREAIEVFRAADPGVVTKAIADHPDLMLEASETGRWEAIPVLAELGFSVDGTKGRTALHHAAGAGSLESVRILVELGADVNKKDPVYDSAPLGWAEYMGRSKVADYLRSI